MTRVIGFQKSLLRLATAICVFYLTFAGNLMAAPSPQNATLPSPASIIDDDVIGPSGPLKNPVSGGWGYTAADPCIINDLSGSAALLTNVRIAAVQYAVIKAKTNMETIIEYGHTVEVIKTKRLGSEFYKAAGNKLFEKVSYTVITAPDSAVSSYGDAPPTPLSQNYSAYQKTIKEVWFDITTPFAKNSILLTGKFNASLLSEAPVGTPVKLPEAAQISPYLITPPSEATSNVSISGGWGYSENDPCVISGAPSPAMLQNQLIQMRNMLEFAAATPSGNVLTPTSQSVTTRSKETINGRNMEKVSYTVYTVESETLYKLNKEAKDKQQGGTNLSKEITKAATPQERVFWFVL